MRQFSVQLRTLTLIVICLTSSLLAQSQAVQTPASSSATGAVPAMVKFSGTVTGSPGHLVGVTFSLYKDQQGGAPLWLETQSVSVDTTGRYSVQLGATVSNGLPRELFASGEARWLGVQREGQSEQPRILLLSVPYALKAGDAETLGGLPASAFVLAAPPTAASSAATTALGTNSAPPANAAITGLGTVNTVPLWDATNDIVNSAISQTGSGTTAKIGINNAAPTVTLDVKGASTIRGPLTMPTTGTATAVTGKNSQPLNLSGSAFKSGTAAALNQTFRLQAEPVGNNTAAPSGKLSLLYYAGANAPAETGLSIASNGQITFAAGQTFPGGGGGGITGVTAGTALTGGGTSGNVTLNLDTTKVPQLSTANIFTGNQSVIGNMTSNGLVSGIVVNAVTGFNIGGNPFAIGSMNTANSFFGFAGNQTGTGFDNVGTGQIALLNFTTGNENTANGVAALKFNTSGSDNTAVGLFALSVNTTGSKNTALGANAGPDSGHPALSNSTAIGANAQVTASNAMVLGSINGVNGATADTLVGIGTTAPTAKLDVRGTANFTGPITFAAGQTFPGAGTVTGVTAGSGLSGGGTSGNVSLSLNTTFSDGRYAQLAAKNIFSGVQVINNSVGIGIAAPTYPLQVSGTMRGDGLSLSSSGNLSVDAPFLPGGRMTILANGNVGINNPAPSTNLDVAGNIAASGTLFGGGLNVGGNGIINGGLTTGAGVSVGGPLSTSGGLSIKGDIPMNAAPHMYFSGFFAGSIAQGQYGGKIRPAKDILITSIEIIGGNQNISACNPRGTISLVNQTTALSMYDLMIDSGSNAETGSGPISVPLSAGTAVYLQVTTQPGCGIFQGPNNIQANVEYVMQ